MGQLVFPPWIQNGQGQSMHSSKNQISQGPMGDSFQYISSRLSYIGERFMEVTFIRSEIIHVYFNRVINKFNKNTQNFPLESSRGTTQTEWKNSIGKGTLRTCKCGLIWVFRDDLNLVVSIKPLQEGEQFLPCKAIQDLVNEEQRKMVLLCSLVKFLVINIDYPPPILLGN